MKVFLSWSGTVSKSVAIAFRGWLPNVIQSIEPWVSSADIESGSRWADTLFKELATDQFGIVCLTKSNLTSPWLNFEAGALAKQVSTARVVPFLFEMEGVELPAKHLLTHLNYVAYPPKTNNREAIKKLVADINLHIVPSLPDARWHSSFEKFWPDLESALSNIASEAAIVDPTDTGKLTLDQDAVLAEILELARNQERLLASLGETAQANERDLGFLTAQLRVFYAQLSITSSRMRDIAELEIGATLTDDILEEVEAIAASLIAVRRQVRSMGESLGVQIAPRVVLRSGSPIMAGMPGALATDGNEHTK